MSLPRLQPPATPTALQMSRPSTPLSNQVAGHQGVMSDESGSLVIKPALPREIAFYQLLNETPRGEPLASLRPFVPGFYGTLCLEGQLDDNGELQKDATQKEAALESVVLENLSYAYTRPCILDAKLGTVLYSPDATEEKKARMDKQARQSTSHETGLRFTGCQTWHEPSQSFIVTPKSFGKSLKVEQLPEGMVRYCPSRNDVLPNLVLPAWTAASGSPPSTASSGPSSLESAPPRLPLAPDVPIQAAVQDPLPSPISKPHETYTQHAIPPEDMVRVLDLIDRHLEAIEAVLRQLEIRFIGASVLIVYEGDPVRLRSALDKWDEVPNRRLGPKVLYPPKSENWFDDEDEDEDGEEDDSDMEDEDEDEDDDDDEDGVAADARRKARCPPVTVRLIDFAHARLAEGEGSDTGVLQGLATLRTLVHRRRDQLHLQWQQQQQQQQPPPSATQ